MLWRVSCPVAVAPEAVPIMNAVVESPGDWKIEADNKEVKPMRISTLDPISMNDVTDTSNAPYYVEGKGPDALKIYFESEANKTEYLDIPLHTANATLTAAYAKVADSDITGTIN